MATPVVTYLPDSVPARTRMGFGPVLSGLFHPFRKSMPVYQEREAPSAPTGPLSQVEMAAATIKADEINADRRRAAVRYLGGVDCTFNPEAESGLLMALRSDRNEAVRYEAALALNNSWCWTRKTVDALNLAMTGSSADGYPTERSDRVRWASWEALSRYAAAINPPQPKELPSQLPAVHVRPASGEVPPQAKTPHYRLPGLDQPTKPARVPEADISSLPPLRPIGQIPDEEPQTPVYEPTPLQTVSGSLPRP